MFVMIGLHVAKEVPGAPGLYRSSFALAGGLDKAEVKNAAELRACIQSIADALPPGTYQSRVYFASKGRVPRDMREVSRNLFVESAAGK